MDERILKLLEDVQILDKQVYGNMTVFPLKFKWNPTFDYITLDEAIDRNVLEAKEIDEGGSVPEIILKNNSDERVFIAEGDQIVGAKQNRTINTIILIEKKSDTKIPVSCVESGRWSYKSKKFTSYKMAAPAFSRRGKIESVNMSLKESGGRSYRSNQGRVWDDVDEISKKFNTKSPTNSLIDVFEEKSDDIENYLKSFKPLLGQNGAIVFINGKLLALDFISNISTFEKYLMKFLRGYAVDAMMEQSDVKSEINESTVKEYLEKFRNLKEEVYQSVGLGEDHRIISDEFLGSSLVVENDVVSFNILRK